jgi:hypothetical protein
MVPRPLQELDNQGEIIIYCMVIYSPCNGLGTISKQL